jgi:hypothetical protein
MASPLLRKTINKKPAVVGGVRVHMDSDIKSLIFGAVWIAFLIIGILWDRKATPDQKVQAMPYIIVVGTLTFLIGGFWASDSWHMAYWVVPAVLLVAVVHSKVMRICPSCGKVHVPLLLIPPRKCSACGGQFA